MCGFNCAGGCQGSYCPPAPTTISTNLNLSTANIAPRTCAQGGEMVRYSVTALTANTATVALAPSAGCLTVGDEVIVINLQGTQAATMNVGNYELRRVLSVSGSTVTFQSAKTKFYGDGVSDDLNLGVARTNQRVVLQRVPVFGNLTVTATSTLTADLWNGVGGGVFALRATGKVVTAGNVDMRGRGYDGAPATTTVAATGRQGESIGGIGLVDDRNGFAGGGAGRGDLTFCPSITNGVAGAGAGHATVGSKGGTVCGGNGGAPIGSMSQTKIFLGSGGASGGTDGALTDNPPGGAGGSFFSNAIFFAARSTVRFEGGAGGDGNAALAGIGGRGSYGRVWPLPSTCSDLHALSGDGEKIFAFGGDSTQPYLAFCTGVGSPTPRMYLTLNNKLAAQNISGLPATRYLTTNSNTQPIINLRNGQLLNFAGFANGDYAGPVTALVPNPLQFGCTPTAKGWPGVYHACNNGSGWHWLHDVAKFVNSDPAHEPMQLFVR